MLASFGVLAWIAIVSVGSAVAKPTAPQGCQASQLTAASRFVKAAFQCWSALQRNPAAQDAHLLCLVEADAEFAVAYLTSLASAGPGVCGLEDSEDELLERLHGEVDGLVFAISGASEGLDKADRDLHAALHRATGGALAGMLGTESRDAKNADELKRQASRSRLRAKLLSAFLKAQAAAADDGVSYAGLPAALVADEVERITDELAALTAPPGTTSFYVEGTVTAAQGSAIDSDVNDTNTTPISNDSFASAQRVPVPAVIGGYVNLPGAGPTGNSSISGDPSDFFQVSLIEGQLVNLRFADPNAADIDLCLYPANGLANPVCSVGTSDTEELSAPSSGAFYIEVFPWSGCDCGSTYVLTLGQTLPTAGPNGVRIDDDFRPGEVIVTLEKSAALAAAEPVRATAFEGSFGMEARGGASDREMLFRLPEEAALRATALGTFEMERMRAGLLARYRDLSYEQREKLDTLLLAKALSRRADVATAEPNFVRYAQVTPNDPLFGRQWHYSLINLPAAWDHTTGGPGVEVAVVDTGALQAHPDLQGQLVAGFDFVSDPDNAADGGGIDSNPEDPGDIQSSFHGSHVAGTVGAKTNNGSGVAGVAWSVQLVPLRVLGFFGGSSYDILQAVRYASGLPNDSGTSNEVDVINLSLGGGGYSSSEQSVYAQARAAGVIVIASAGNDGERGNPLSYPASYDGVVSVSAVDLLKQKAYYSSFGATVDVAAPGGDVRFDRNGDGYSDGVLSTLKDAFTGLFNYVPYQGTSMAAPHVAGVAALMKAVNPSLTPDQFDSLLAGGSLTTDLGAPGRDDFFGYGLIDAREAVEAAGAPTEEDPILLVSPAGLNLGTAGVKAQFQVSNGGGGALLVTDLSDDQPWISVAGTSIDANGNGTYEVTVSRDGLAPGTYVGTIAIETSAGSSSVSVVMAVVTDSTTPDAGYHYVLLVDPDTFDTVAQFDAAAVGGTYPYLLTDVPAGEYLLYGGTDSDNDNFICGIGEACGAFPTLGSPQVLQVTSDLSPIDFVTGFLQSISTNTASSIQGARLPPPAAQVRQRKQVMRRLLTARDGP